MSFKKGIKTNGGITLSNLFYNTNDSVKRRDPYQYIVSGNFNIDLFGYNAPVSFTCSNSQRSYTQPFNRLNFAPQYKWIRVYVGYTNMNFSPYTLSGYGFKGAGAELSPGNWKIAFMGGRLKRAVEYDPLKGSIEGTSYKRMGYALKLGYEKGTSGISANIFTAGDDENSIAPVPGNILLHPLKNLAAGFSSHITLFKHLTLEGEYSFSVLNGDIRTINSDRNSLPEDNSLLSVNLPVTRKFDAWSFGTGYKAVPFSIMFRYERVAPDYQTLGAYYFNNDNESFTLVPTFRLLKNRLSVTGNVGIQKNNLDNRRESTTKRLAGACNINYDPSVKWNLSFNFSNFSTFTNIKPHSDPFYTDSMDSLNFYQVTNQVNGSVRHMLGAGESASGIILIASYQDVTENGNGINDETSSGNLNLNASWSAMLSDAGISMSLLYNMLSSGSPGLRSLYHGPGISISKMFFNRTLRTGLNATYNISSVNTNKNSSVFSSGLNVSYSPERPEGAKQRLTGNITFVGRSPSQKGKYSSEIISAINYSVSF
jgi:hypothetical protein